MCAAGSTHTPGFAFIHGGLHGAWCWDDVVRLLEWPAVAVDLPGRGSRPAPLSTLSLDDFADAAVSDITAANIDPCVVVAHSMGGLTAPMVVGRLGTSATHVVMISCLVAPENTAAVDVLPPIMSVWMRRRFGRAARRADGALTIPRWLARRLFCNDLDPETAAQLLDRLCPDAPAIMLQRAACAGMPSHVPRTWIRLLHDRAVKPRMQDRMVQNLGGADIVTIAAGHDVMLSQPEALASVLNDIGRAAFGASSSARSGAGLRRRSV